MAPRAAFLCAVRKAKSEKRKAKSETRRREAASATERPDQTPRAQRVRRAVPERAAGPRLGIGQHGEGADGHCSTLARVHRCGRSFAAPPPLGPHRGGALTQLGRRRAAPSQASRPSQRSGIKTHAAGRLASCSPARSRHQQWPGLRKRRRSTWWRLATLLCVHASTPSLHISPLRVRSNTVQALAKSHATATLTRAPSPREHGPALWIVKR